MVAPSHRSPRPPPLQPRAPPLRTWPPVGGHARRGRNLSGDSSPCRIASPPTTPGNSRNQPVPGHQQLDLRQTDSAPRSQLSHRHPPPDPRRRSFTSAEKRSQTIRTRRYASTGVHLFLPGADNSAASDQSLRSLPRAWAQLLDLPGRSSEGLVGTGGIPKWQASRVSRVEVLPFLWIPSARRIGTKSSLPGDSFPSTCERFGDSATFYTSWHGVTLSSVTNRLCWELPGLSSSPCSR